MKFGSFVEEYEQYIAQLAASTQAKYRAHLRKHIRPAFDEFQMIDVTTKAIELWLVGKKQSGLAWATRCDLRNILSGIFTVAERWGDWSGPNPARRVNVGRKRAVRERRKLSQGQISRLLADLPKDVALIVEMALFCTLRISEVLGLCWKHVDLVHGIVHIRQRYWRGDLDETKTDSANRNVPIGRLVEKLRAIYPAGGMKASEKFVFRVRTCRGYTRSDRSIARYFLRPAAERLGIYFPGFGFHSFRREAITGLAAESDALQAMRLAGHARMDTTLLYGLDDLPRQEAAIIRLQDAIARAGRPRLTERKVACNTTLTR